MFSTVYQWYLTITSHIQRSKKNVYLEYNVCVMLFFPMEHWLWSAFIQTLSILSMEFGVKRLNGWGPNKLLDKQFSFDLIFLKGILFCFLLKAGDQIPQQKCPLYPQNLPSKTHQCTNCGKCYKQPASCICKMSFSSQTFATTIAFLTILIVMNFIHVSFELTAVLRAFFTRLTFERFDAFMNCVNMFFCIPLKPNCFSHCEHLKAGHSLVCCNDMFFKKTTLVKGFITIFTFLLPTEAPFFLKLITLLQFFSKCSGISVSISFSHLTQQIIPHNLRPFSGM